jgi:hypothetical protein
MKKRRITTVVTAGLLAVGAAAVSLLAAAPASAATICDQFGTVVAGNYVIMNNRWGTSATQCINTTANGFSITQQDGVGNTSGAPTAYPAIYLGCHYSNCSPNSPLPRQISQIGSAPGSINVSFPSNGTWNSAYDVWLNADTNVSGVQDTEIMIWLNRQGQIQPIGSQTGTANLAGRSWNVWTGSNGQNNVVSYLFTGSPLSSFNFDLMAFVRDTLSRGSQYGTNSWYLTSVQAGFEPWQGGVGLTVNSFSQTINGGTQNPQVPGTPGAPSCSTTTNSASLNWAASSGTVNSYQIERATGATSTSFSQVGTSTSTSFTNTGLANNTTYRYRVRATNSAGNSAFSPTTNCTTGGQQTTTTSQPPGQGGCSASVTTGAPWSDGFQANVSVTNTGQAAINSWRVVITLPSGATIRQIWSARNQSTSNPYTVINEVYNGNLGPNASTTFGFIVARNGTSSTSVSVACSTP